jgi:hypothetical protein
MQLPDSTSGYIRAVSAAAIRTTHVNTMSTYVTYFIIFFLGTAEVRPVDKNTVACTTHKLTYFIEKKA